MGHERSAPLARGLKALFLFAAFFLTVSSAACQSQRPTIPVRFQASDGRTLSPTLQAEIASTHSERQLGLMYRKSLGDTESMLFVFPDERPRSFWMKNTYVELDIIFLDKELRVVSIAERATPLTETSRSSAGPARYVLEVRGGLSKSWSVAPGARLSVEGSLPNGES